MTGHPHFRWLRPVRQARSQATLEKLLESTESLLADKGFEGVTVAEIAMRAGVSVGAVYSRFRGKDALLQCLLDRFVDEATTTTDKTLDFDRWQGACIEEIASEFIVFLVEIHRERIGLLRELVARAHNSVEMGERKEELIRHIGDRLAALLLAREQEITHPDPAFAVSFALRLALGCLEQAILSGGSVPYGLPESDDRLAAELTRTFLNYLGVMGGADAAARPNSQANRRAAG